jgi:hypothetical protein
MSIIAVIAAGMARHLDQTGRAPTVLELGPADAARYDRWLRMAMAPLGGSARLNADTCLGMRVVRVGTDAPMRFLSDDGGADGRAA